MGNSVYQDKSSTTAYVTVNGSGVEEVIDLGWIPSAVFGLKANGTNSSAGFIMWSTMSTVEAVGYAQKDGSGIPGATDATDQSHVLGNFSVSELSEYDGVQSESGASKEKKAGQGFKLSAAACAANMSYYLICIR